MASSDSQINKPQRGRPKRAELPDVNINTGVQSINSERASLCIISFMVVWYVWFVVYNCFFCGLLFLKITHLGVLLTPLIPS